MRVRMAMVALGAIWPAGLSGPLCAHLRWNKRCLRSWARTPAGQKMNSGRRRGRYRATHTADPVAIRHANCFNPDGAPGRIPLMFPARRDLPAEQLRRAALPVPLQRRARSSKKANGPSRGRAEAVN
jgi:hypothetical protein